MPQNRTLSFRLALTSLLVLGLAAPPTSADRLLQTVDITDMVESPLDPSHVIAPVIPVRHDPRCSVPVRLAINTTLDPIPNPLGEPFLSLADAVAVLEEAAQQWNDIPTSFFEIALEGTSQNLGESGFDFVSEVTFRPGFTFGFLESQGTLAPYGILQLSELHFISSDAELTDGLDFDGDGDPDAVAGIETCQDVDGDGDIEYPTGHYPAGTILDFDVQFGASDLDNPFFGLIPGTRFTTDPAAVDDEQFSVDLGAVAVPAFGLVHTIAHTLSNQSGSNDGVDGTFYPFLDTTDPVSEQARSQIDLDAVAQVSALYPEGSAEEGPAALQEGDIAFAEVFGWITGSVHSSQFDNPATGLSVSARDHDSGRVVSTAYSGEAPNLEFDPAIGALLAPSDAEFNSPDGDFSLVVPQGTYDIAIEGADGTPVLPFPVNLSTQVGALLGLSLVTEEFYNARGERASERSAGKSVPIAVQAGEVVEGIDFVTNQSLDIVRHGFTLDAYTSREQTPWTYYAVRIPGQSFAFADAGPQTVAHSANFLTAPARGSEVAVFAKAMLTTGRVEPDGTPVIDLDRPIESQRPFFGQEGDYSPLYFRRPAKVVRQIRSRLAGADEDLFLVLRLPITGDEMPRIGLDGGFPENDAPIFEDSYVSTDGGATWTVDTEFNYMFNLTLSLDPSVNPPAGN